MSQFSTVAAFLLLGLVVILGGHVGQAAVAKVKLNNSCKFVLVMSTWVQTSHMPY